MPTGIYLRRKRDWQDRFWAKVNKNGPLPKHRPSLGRCWLWTGATNLPGWRGYGSFYLDGKNRLAHRVIYESVKGLIPSGKESDHLCHVRRCVNPDHIEPVTGKENCRRGDAPRLVALRSRIRGQARTHCKRGHPFNKKNTGIVQGYRRCRACNRERMRRVNSARNARQMA